MAQTAVRAVSCDSCGKQYRYKPELAGKKVKCPCGGRVRFPLDTATEEPEQPQVDLALQQLAQAEAEAPQYDTPEEEAPPPAPPLPSKTSSRASALGVAKSKIASRLKEEVGHPPSKHDGDRWKWWYYVAGGVGMFGYAVWEWIDISFAERTHDNPIEHLRGSSRTLYMLLGKVGVVGATVAIALAAIAIGMWQFKERRDRA